MHHLWPLVTFMTNAAGSAAIGLNLARAHRAGVHRLGGARPAGKAGMEPGPGQRRGAGWVPQWETGSSQGTASGKGLGKAQKLLGRNLCPASGRVLISLFNPHPCLPLDPLPERLPTLTGQELPTSSWAPAGADGTGRLPWAACARVSTETKGLPTPRGCRAGRCMSAQQSIN